MKDYQIENPNEFRQLLRDYKTETSKKKKAEIGKRLWDLLSPGERLKHKNQGYFMRSVFGGSVFGYQQHVYLLKAYGSKELWRRVDHEGMPISTAVRLHREARAYSKDKGIPLIDALAKVLQVFDKLPSRKDGTRHKPVRKIHRKKKASPDADTFWSQLRESIREHVAEKLPDCDFIEMDPLWREFEIDLQTAIVSFQNRINYRQKQQEKIVEPIKRRKLREACEILHMDPPTKARPLDLHKAKKQKRLLARTYHPDAHGGDDSMREHYEAVLDAYRVIETWHHQNHKETEAR